MTDTLQSAQTQDSIQQPTDTQSQPQSNEDVGLTVQDLVTLRNIVDVSASRGTFKAAEMESIGKIYNKLSTFLDTVEKNSQANQSAQ